MTKTYTAQELTTLIRGCFIDSVDQHGNLTKVIDHETLYVVYLEMINHLSDEIQVLRQQMDKIKSAVATNTETNIYRFIKELHSAKEE